MEFQTTAILGAGLIGASWTALILASGRTVRVYDPSDETEAFVRRTIEDAWPILEDLGLTGRGTPDAVTFHEAPADAVEGASFVQESTRERLPLKHELFAQIEEALEPDAIVSSSTSGLTLAELQNGFRDPSRLILGHPFNPPHLIPLVELTGNDRTAEGVLDAAERFYADLGKVTIRLNREATGHVANRLQAAVWREAVHLVTSGVASVEDVDKAIWAGPGLRWAAMGPTAIYSLAAGPGGLAAFIDHFGDSFDRWWDDLGTPKLDAATREKMVAGMTEAAKGKSVAELSAERDAMVIAIQKATSRFR